MGRWLGRPEVLDLPGVETIGLQAIVNCFMWVLGMELRFSGRSILFSFLNTIFPALKQILEEAFKKIKVVLFVAYDGDRF